MEEIAVAQREAGIGITSLERRLDALDAQMDIADRLVRTDPAIARKMLAFGRKQAVDQVRQAGEQLEGRCVRPERE